MDPAPGQLSRSSSQGLITRSGSLGFLRSDSRFHSRTNSEADGLPRGFTRLNSKVDLPVDLEEAITRWGSISFRSASQNGRKTALGKFGSQNSVSVLDHLAAGGDINLIPCYDIYVKNLSYKVTFKSKDKGTIQRTLLSGVNAEAHHGEVLAVVGPSGSGKTTFLDALAGRVAKRSLEGEVFVNGELIDHSFQYISGYVMQDDATFPMLTVRETLLYSARLRLPSLMPLAEKRARVDSMIKQLGLMACADTRVGNEKIRGVSGGERRRVSIGSDLIHDPAVLFLDEPTSGLDSTSALNVMQNLQRMATSGKRTVILTIHQPSYRILETIDKVLVLGMGNVIYHGIPAGIKHYFDPLGRSMPEFVNVIEYALDTIEDCQRSPEGLQPLIMLHVATNKNARTDQIVDAMGMPEEEEEEEDNGAISASKYATGFLSECFVLASRNLKNTYRTPELFLSRASTMVVIAITNGTLFLQVGVDEKGIRQRTSFIAFVLALMIFTSTEAMGIFIDERHIYIRETSRGAYRASSYVISGAAITVPFLLILAILFSSIGYFIVGLVLDPSAFFFFVFVVWLTLCMANSFVCFISALVPNFSVGNSIVSALISYFFLFSGYFIQRSAIPKYWIWLHYLSMFKYPFESLIKNEFGNRHFNGRIWYGSVTSREILSSFSAGKVHQGINVLAMIVMFLGYRVLFWLILKYFTKSIRR